jgi:hypothetical protein
MDLLSDFCSLRVALLALLASTSALLAVSTSASLLPIHAARAQPAVIMMGKKTSWAMQKKRKRMKPMPKGFSVTRDETAAEGIPSLAGPPQKVGISEEVVAAVRAEMAEAGQVAVVEEAAVTTAQIAQLKAEGEAVIARRFEIAQAMAKVMEATTAKALEVVMLPPATLDAPSSAEATVVTPPSSVVASPTPPRHKSAKPNFGWAM